MKYLLAILFILSANSAFSHTWDEPWHKQVVTNSNSFGLYKVESSSGNTIKVKLVKHLAGDKLKEKLKISTFYLYEYGLDEDEHPFEFVKGQPVYLYIKKKGNQYSIATPTAGIDQLMENGMVVATFRHSLHKAEVSKESYEALQSCIYLALHSLKCPDETINKYILSPINKKVAALSENASENEIALFFEQHAALETAYLISLPIPETTLKPFLDSDFFHVQIAAVRALYASNDPMKIEKLIDFIKSEKNSDIAKIIAIILLKESKSDKPVNPLKEYLPAASTEETYLGGSLMDPRIGTWFPENVKSAIEWYLMQ